MNVQQKLDLIRSMPVPLHPAEQRKLTVMDVGKGSFVQINKTVYRVDEVNRYESGSDKWYELKLVSLLTGNVEWLEWENDDELEVWVNRKDNIKLKSLGLSSRKLEDMDEDENDDAEYKITYNGKPLYYEDSGDANFFRNNGRKKEKFYFWDFFNEGQTKQIGIEEWDDEYEISYSEKIDPGQVTVLVK